MPIQDYLDLVTSQHRQKPRFMATLEALLRPLCDLEDLLASMPKAFDVDSAVGAQLDQVGEWVGRSRKLAVPLNATYFSWGNPGLGWGSGVWRGLGDPLEGIIVLPDDIYRALLKAKIAANAWDGTIPGAYAIWDAVFGDSGGSIFITDNQDMSMSLGIAGLPPGAILVQLLLQGYIPLKPAGMRIQYYVIEE